MLAEAKTLDATDLKKLARRLLTVVDPDGEERRDEKALDRLERAAHLGRLLSISEDQAGGAWIKGRCTSEDAALIKATLIPWPHRNQVPARVCDPGTCNAPGCGRRPRPTRPRHPDARRARPKPADNCRPPNILPESHGAVPRLTLTMTLDDLREPVGVRGHRDR